MEFLNTINGIIKEYQDNFKKLNTSWYSEVEKDIDYFQNQCNELIRKFNENHSFAQRVQLTNEFLKKIYDQLQFIKSRYQNQKYNKDFTSFYNTIKIKIHQLPEKVVIKQSSDRFKILPDDTVFIKLMKPIKKLFFEISKIPFSTGNFFRKIFKKELKTDFHWKQEIKIRELTTYFVRTELSVNSISIIENNLKLFNKIYSKLFSLVSLISEKTLEALSQEDIDSIVLENPKYFDELIAILNSAQAKFRISDENYEELYSKFNVIFNRSNTIEFPYSKFDKKTIESLNNDLNNKYKNIINGIQININALFDDWELFLEVSHYATNTLLNYSNLLDDVDNNLNDFKDKYIDSTLETLNESIENLINFSGDRQDYIKRIQFEKDSLIKYFNSEFIGKMIDNLINKNIPILLDEFEGRLNSGLKNISKERTVVKFRSEKHIGKESVVKISPQEILIYDAFPKLGENIKSIKSKILTVIERIQNDIYDLIEIVDYNLESSINFITENEEIKDSEITNNVKEGLDRAVAKATNIIDKIESIKGLIRVDLKGSIDKFNEALLELNNTDKLLQKKLVITRERALKKSKQYGLKVKNYIITYYPIVRDFIKDKYNLIKTKYYYLRRRLGIDKPAEFISSEFADFLSNIDAIKNRLPFVYRKLFDNYPLTDKRFYEPRINELEKLKKSLLNFRNQNYSNVLLIGERGSGKTTLINMFLKDEEPDETIIRFDFSNIKFNGIKITDTINELLKPHHLKIENLSDDVIDKKIIIVMENCQHLFIKKVGGFNILKEFLSIIEKTYRNIFWIITIDYYAWNYLHKTISMTEHFGTVIKLNAFEDEVIYKLIDKRHRVSGFQIKFQPSIFEKESKKFNKLDDVQKQQYLQLEFFKDLNKIAKGNPSIAQLYWILSAKNSGDNLITIDSLKELNFSFLKTLSLNKLVILHNLLLHGRLDIETLSKVMNNSINSLLWELNVLIEDGLVVYNGTYYSINLFLYRQIVDLLKSKNFVH